MLEVSTELTKKDATSATTKKVISVLIYSNPLLKLVNHLANVNTVSEEPWQCSWFVKTRLVQSSIKSSLKSHPLSLYDVYCSTLVYTIFESYISLHCVFSQVQEDGRKTFYFLRLWWTGDLWNKFKILCSISESI